MHIKSAQCTFFNSLSLFCRRMFPTVRCSFTNLRPDMKYWVLLDIVPCDNKRYRYAYHRSSWLVAGKADPPPPHRLYAHPDAPYTGDQLRKQVVSFEKVKLTNNEMDKNGQVCVCTHQKEYPRQTKILGVPFRHPNWRNLCDIQSIYFCHF